MTDLDAPRECSLCPRLVDYRHEARAENPEWFNAPVPSWGPADARLIVVGLAPGLKGANRTGRPFTGDFAGDLLYRTLGEAGVAHGTYAARPDDGLVLDGVMVTNAVRCVPPQNKPVGAEINTCRQYLTATLEAHGKARTLLALGRIAHESVVVALGHKRAHFRFGHGARHEMGQGRRLFDSYHCSRYNTNTGVLTAEMFREVVFAACADAEIGRWNHTDG